MTTLFFRRLAAALTAVLLVAAACSDTDADTTTTTTTVPDTTTTIPAPTTTTTTAHPPILGLNVEGSSLIYSATGEVGLQGRVTQPDAEVTATIAGAPIEVHGAGDAFWLAVSLDPGTHDIVLFAVTTGATATLTITVVVDPDLDVGFAYVEALDLASMRLQVRWVEWLTGDEAVAAARADGVIGTDDDLDGGYYIRAIDPTVYSLVLAADPVVVLQACFPDEGPCVTMQRVAIDTWQQLLADPGSGVEITGWWWYGEGHLPFWVTRRDGEVVQLEEHYLP